MFPKESRQELKGDKLLYKYRDFLLALPCFREREIEKFRVAVSVPSGARMLFSLSYEELLPRRLGRYELSLGLRPGQLVQNLTLDVTITERTGISFIKVLPLKTSRLLSNTAQGKGVPSHWKQIHKMTGSLPPAGWDLVLH